MPNRSSAVALAVSLSCCAPLAFSADERPVQARFHVDPQRGDDSSSGDKPETAFRSIERARDAARAVNTAMTGDIVISLRGGDYQLTRPIALTDADSGSNGFTVIYSAYPNEVPRLSGGQRVSGWRLYDAAKNVYIAQLPQAVRTRQLFIDGRRAVRARSVAGLTKPTKTPDGYTCANVELAGWKNISEVEFVYRQIWTAPRLGIDKLEVQGDRLAITMRRPGLDNARNKGITSIGDPWYIENAYELLDEPGEWYLDSTGAISGMPNCVFYKPYAWEAMEQVQAVVPVLEHLITVEGASIDKPAHHIAFSGIEFRHTTWLRPGSEFGVPDAQNNVMRENATKTGEFIANAAALNCRYTRNMEVRRCRFSELGSIAITMRAGAQNSTIEGCSFTDISANGIQVGDYLRWDDPRSENYFMPDDGRLHIAGNRIANNYFNRCGVEFRSATAIAITFARNCVIAHNEIYNMPYSGIHLGWAWNKTPKTIAGANLIERNRVQNVMVELADGAGFYNLGSSDPVARPNVIRGNYVRQSRWGQGYYFDENSSHFDLIDNVSESISDYNLKLNGVTHHVTSQRLYSNKQRDTVGKLAHDNDVQPTILIDDNTRAAADAIKAAAGLQEAYADVRPAPRHQLRYEAEEAQLAGGAFADSGIGTGIHGYSGMGFVSGIQNAGATMTFNVYVSKAGSYVARFRCASHKGDAQGLQVSINGDGPAMLPELKQAPDKHSWSVVACPVTLKEGTNTVVLSPASAGTTPLVVDNLELLPQ